MAGISLTGMASGLDTDSIISQLMALEQNKVTAVQKRQVSVTQHKADLSNIKAKLDAVKSAAGIGGHSIQVNKLASSEQHGFTYDSVAAEGKLKLFYGIDPNTTTSPDN